MANLEKHIAENLADSCQVLHQAIGSKTKAIAYNLRRIGRRITASAVEKWFTPTVNDLPRANWYRTAKENLLAIYEASPAGFELILTDFELFIRDVRRRRKSKSIYALPHPVMTEYDRIFTQIKQLATAALDVGSVMEAA